MIEEPQIVESAEINTAFIRITVPRDKIQEVMGPGLRELMDAISAQGIPPAGPWFTHHLKMDPEIFDVEISVPVNTPISPAGRMKPGKRPRAKIVRSVYHGDYEGLAGGWQECDAWIAEQELTPGPDLWEEYKIGPETNPDPIAWRTELSRPLVGG